MKKILSVILILSMLMGILGTYPFVFASEANNTLYSGGSGTEDDPYLISCEDDIKELYDNIVNIPELYGQKKHYKLTNDISIKSPASPLYEDELYGLHCFQKTGIHTGKVAYTLYPWNDYSDILDGLYYHGDEMTEIYETEFLSTMGPVYFKETIYNKDLQTYVKSEYFTGGNNAADIYFTAIDVSMGGTVMDKYDTYVYRAAAFTGIFDGSGYSIYGENTYLFGFAKNGAVIKNLNLKGNDFSLAYEIDETVSVSNCAYSADSPYDFGCTRILLGGLEDTPPADYGGDGPFLVNRTLTQPYVIVNNKGKVTDFSISTNTTKNLLQYGNFSTSIDFSESEKLKNNENVYTLSECEAAGGDSSVFIEQGFDFENTWVMKDGLPYLRISLEKGTGDIDLDDITNGKDANLLKRYLSGADYNAAYTHAGCADLDGDGDVTPKDSALLKRILAGN